MPGNRNQPPVNSLPRAARLTLASEFEHVLRKPEINLVRGPLRLRARTNKLSRARLGLVVGKRGNPLAVRRNRIKRIIRDRFRRAACELPALDIVVQVVTSAEDAEIDRALAQLFDRLPAHAVQRGSSARQTLDK